MKYTLTTNDKQEALRALGADDLCAVIFEMQVELRKDWKYNDNKDMGEHWHDVLREIMEEYGVSLDKIWS